jgi:2-polyprenyl-3-methyl-5-hydroxy-6-metoxy-1,4-benzoquinol methylase
MSTTAAITSDPQGWATSQIYELNFWRNDWPYRTKPVTELQKHRHDVAIWFLKLMGFEELSESTFKDFAGRVLEVGSGPIGFFELMDSVDVTAIDPLMRAYAEHLPFSLLGKRGSTLYSASAIDELPRHYNNFVVCSNVLDHTADWIETLELCTMRLQPGGELLLYTDSRGAPALGHTQVFTPGQLRRVLRILGATEFIIDKTDKNAVDHADFTNILRVRF